MTPTPPVRQCAVCRKKDIKKKLIRIVRKTDGSFALDLRQTINGRGLYLCRSARCVESARQRDIIGRTFETTLAADFYLQLARVIRPSPVWPGEKLLGFAIRSRQVQFGVTAVETGLNRRQVHLILMDKEAGPSTKSRISGWETRHQVPVIELPEPGALERISGKINCKCLGVTHREFASKMKELNEHDEESSPNTDTP